MLMLAAAVALIWANSPWATLYHALWGLPLEVGVAGLRTEVSLHWLVNEGLMTFFFLLVGLEIRRELYDGALSSPRLAVVPVVAALGGVVTPALIYHAIATHETLRRGWAIPTATDIAFAVGALTLLGKRIAPNVRVLLLSLAVIDDIAAILIIAILYSGGINLTGAPTAALGIVLALGFQRLQVHGALAYLLPGAIIWLGLIDMGVHPTLAGVILGLLTPTGPRETLAPDLRAQSALHPWVAYGIMPLFALANAGVELQGLQFGLATDVALSGAVICGLVLGKPLGIIGFTWLVTRTRFGALAPGVTWCGVALVGCLGGIGFTMSLFMANLAFSDVSLLSIAKLSILLGSLAAAVLGLLLGRYVLFNRPHGASLGP